MVCSTAHTAIKTTDSKFACIGCAGTTATPANTAVTGIESCTNTNTYADVAGYTSKAASTMTSVTCITGSATV